MALLSIAFRIELEKSILVAASRMIAQLFIIGFLLTKIFQLKNPWLIVFIGFLMITAAIHANSQRVTERPPFFWFSSTLSISFCIVLSLSFALFVIVDSSPWYDPRYLIPFLGLLIGNSLTGISLGMSSIIQSLEEHRDEIESFLALGASPREAGEHFLKKALRSSLTPILNAMTIAGLVSLPGVMTGQILAGASPSAAAHYQIAIMCLLGFSTLSGSIFSVFFLYHKQFNKEHQLRTP